jgi:hypothetical protein
VTAFALFACVLFGFGCILDGLGTAFVLHEHIEDEQDPFGILIYGTSKPPKLAVLLYAGLFYLIEIMLFHIFHPMGDTIGRVCEVTFFLQGIAQMVSGIRMV